MAGARDYKPNDLKRLFALSGCECANPSCNNKLIAKDYNSILGEICHIEAASSDGPRFNPKQTNDERRSFDNLILLCESCHKIIDNKANEKDYPVELLKKWKKNHQEKILNSINGSLPNYFQQIVNAIAANNLMNVASSDAIPYDISEKIEYNCLKKNKYIVEEYNIHTIGLHNLYDELEVFGTIKKNVVLNRIRHLYLEAKGKNTDGSIVSIRAKSDDIFDEVVENVCTLVGNTQLDESELFLAVQIVVVDAFIDCKVLEKPIV
ncbi:MAG: ABC-three component system protein [Paludibacteraceae bacterium]|nr:ABC-three component system protein [Paludibacteraceae bacterium]